MPPLPSWELRNKYPFSSITEASFKMVVLPFISMNWPSISNSEFEVVKNCQRPIWLKSCGTEMWPKSNKDSCVFAIDFPNYILIDQSSSHVQFIQMCRLFQ